MAKVQFHDTDEFLAELALDAASGAVTDRIVRATANYRTGASGITYVEVVATYLARGLLVELVVAIGNTLEPEQVLKAKRNDTLDQIEAAVEADNLEVRTGRFLEAR